MLPELLDQVEGPIAQVSGDGGYDYADCYEAIAKRNARATISPRGIMNLPRFSYQ
jgi:hypothetical protein